MKETSKEIFNKLIDYLKECIEKDVSKDIIIDKLNSYSDKVGTITLKGIVESYFRLQYNLNSLKGNDELNFQILFEGNKRGALGTLEYLREQYNIANTTK